MWKLFQLNLRRFFRNTFFGKGFWLSFGLLIFSFFVLLMILFPICYDRIPVYSYFVEEWKLPISYNFSGKVEIVDANDKFVNKDVEIFVGGYSTTANSIGEFHLVFSAPTATEIFAVIKYTNLAGQTITKTESLVIKGGIHDIEKDFKYDT
ncbi:MAG: hypothetical protein ACM3PE_01900 [Deltaproteobacteria bacterium]